MLHLFNMDRSLIFTRILTRYTLGIALGIFISLEFAVQIFAAQTGGGYTVQDQINATPGIVNGGGYGAQVGGSSVSQTMTGGGISTYGGAYRSPAVPPVVVVPPSPGGGSNPVPQVCPTGTTGIYPACVKGGQMITLTPNPPLVVYRDADGHLVYVNPSSATDLANNTALQSAGAGDALGQIDDHGYYQDSFTSTSSGRGDLIKDSSLYGTTSSENSPSNSTTVARIHLLYMIGFLLFGFILLILKKKRNDGVINRFDR
jgi:hypothetical protein